jgi:phage-related protein
MNSWVGSIAGTVSNIPNIVRNAIGDLSGALFGAGQSVIRGLINGINAMLGPLRSALSAVTSLIPSWKGPPAKDAKLLYGSGRLILGGLIAGIDSALPQLRGQLGGVTGMFGGSQSFSVAASAATQSGGDGGFGGSPTIVINAPLGVDRSEVVAAVHQGLRDMETARG